MTKLKKKTKESKRANEQKNQEEENRQRLLQKQERKESQIELTNNLKKTYGHIKPTIIQAQRILKVICNMLEKMGYVFELNTSMIQNITEDELEQLTDTTQKFIKELRHEEQIFFEFKEELQIQENLYKTLKEEERELHGEDDTKSEANEEQREVLKEIEEKQTCIEEQGQKIMKRIRNFVRYLEKEQSDFESIKRINKGYDRELIIRDAYDCVESIYYLFVKKLSTGFDEEESHKMLLQKLLSNVKDNTHLLEAKQKELDDIRTQRKNENDRINNEITELTKQKEDLQKQFDEGIKNLMEKSEETKELNKQEHEERKKKLKETIEKIQKELTDLEKKNEESENGLNNQIKKDSNGLKDLIREQDNIKDKFIEDYNTHKVS